MRTFPLPQLFRQKIPRGDRFFRLTKTLSDFGIHTVCQEAKCPNRTDCYSQGTLTFQILGNLCTRRCGFCAETTGLPNSIDFSEPERIVQAVERLNLSHVVITAPARDDLLDGGASLFAQTVFLIKEKLENVTVEILISDLQGCKRSLQTVLESWPDVFNHNIETVRRLTPSVRAKATYDRSLEILRSASQFFESYNGKCNNQIQLKTKSGLMVGLGEEMEEIFKTFQDLRNVGVNYLTCGQYLQPSPKHLSIKKFYSSEEFVEIKKMAERIGFEKVFCGPKVRSSYHAEEMMVNV